MDKLITGVSENREVRIYFADTTNIAEEIRRINDASPVSTAILARVATSALLMSMMSKIDEEKLTFQIKGDREMKLAVAVADNQGNVKVSSSYTKIPTRYNTDGGLDLVRAVGKGKMIVIKDIGVGEPFIGQTELVTGDLAEDLAHYFAQSEQIATAVGLGVKLDNEKACVARSGGFIVQRLPGASEETMEYITDRIIKMGMVSELFKKNKGLEETADLLMGDLGMAQLETREIRYHCGCSKEGIVRGLKSLGSGALKTILEEDGGVETHCNFCKTVRNITGDELRQMIADLDQLS